MKVTVLTIVEKLYEGEACEVILPGDDGEFSVWDFHQTCLYVLRQGNMTIIPRFAVSGERLAQTEHRTPNTEHRISIKRGMARIEPHRLVAMVEI